MLKTSLYIWYQYIYTYLLKDYQELFQFIIINHFMNLASWLYIFKILK